MCAVHTSASIHLARTVLRRRSRLPLSRRLQRVWNRCLLSCTSFCIGHQFCSRSAAQPVFFRFRRSVSRDFLSGSASRGTWRVIDEMKEEKKLHPAALQLRGCGCGPRGMVSVCLEWPCSFSRRPPPLPFALPCLHSLVHGDEPFLSP